MSITRTFLHWCSVQTRYPTYVGDVAEVCFQMCEQRVKQVRAVWKNILHLKPSISESHQRPWNLSFLWNWEIYEIPIGYSDCFSLSLADRSYRTWSRLALEPCCSTTRKCCPRLPEAVRRIGYSNRTSQLLEHSPTLSRNIPLRMAQRMREFYFYQIKSWPGSRSFTGSPARKCWASSSDSESIDCMEWTFSRSTDFTSLGVSDP